MDTLMQQALDKLIEEIDDLTDEINKNPLIEKIRQKKKFANEFSKNIGGELLYIDALEESISIIPGQFKGFSLSKAVRWFLEKRSKENPPTFEEIREALKQGDYDGKVSDIRVAIMKNNQITLLKGGGVQRFGLVEWYGKKRKTVKNESGEEIEIDDAEDENSENEEESTESVKKEDNNTELDLNETKKETH